jgi:ADP-heptose:LPS heptosyltransferase
VLKRLEWFAKNALATVLAVLLWRPGRRARARRTLGSRPRGRVLLVRPDNRVGEALLLTPLVDALARLGFAVHVLVHAKVRRVLEGHPSVTQLWSDGPRLPLLRALRAERFEVVVDCGNWAVSSVTAAVLARLAGPHAVVLGPAHAPAGWLMDVAVEPRTDTRNEGLQRAHLASALVGELPGATLTFRPTPVTTQAPGTRYAVINPGGRLGYRRVEPALFAVAARVALERGVTPVVTWGPGEETLADEVCALEPRAVRAPPTSLDQLASLMRGATFAVCNNTGPMHLSVACGCRTLGLFLHMDVERWGHPAAPHVMLDLTPVPEAARAAAVEAALRAWT